MLWSFLERLAIPGRELRLNSVGDPACRPAFREALSAWLAPRLDRLCEDCRRRAADNPLRVFDCKIEADRVLLAEAPTVLDCLCAPCRDHFDAVRAALDAYAIPYAVDPTIVRGLDYYQRTVFEVVAGGLGAQNALLGGGRYDGLVEELGGPSIPGFGFAIGIERLVMLLPEGRTADRGTDLAIVGLGPDGWRASVGLARRLRAAGIAVAMPLAERPLGAQMKRAERLGARWAVFVGSGELAAGRFGVKNLETGEQVDWDEATLTERVRGLVEG
jgi:histidyl-tRNA synthetase